MKALESTGLAVLNKADYERVLKKVEIKKGNTKIEFFQTVPFFQCFTIS